MLAEAKTRKEIRDALWNPANGRHSSELDIQNSYLRRKDERIAGLTAELASVRLELASTQIRLRQANYRTNELVPDAVNVPLIPTGTRPSIKQIIMATCREFQVTPQGIMSRQQIAILAYPRKVIYYLASTLTELPLAQIGRRMGRDHTTVLCGVRSIKKKVDDGDGELKARILSIKIAMGVE
jgi:chromosomal replication initiation ATPase DnaA